MSNISPSPPPHIVALYAYYLVWILVLVLLSICVVMILSYWCFIFPQILDLVIQGLVSLKQVRDIPGTLHGLYLWIFQSLFPKDFEYAGITRGIFNILLASRQPLTSTQVYNCLLTRTPKLQVFSGKQVNSISFVSQLAILLAVLPCKSLLELDDSGRSSWRSSLGYSLLLSQQWLWLFLLFLGRWIRTHAQSVESDRCY